MMLWSMVPGYSPLRVIGDDTSQTKRVTSFFGSDAAQPGASVPLSTTERSSCVTYENSSLHIFVGTWNHGQYPQDDTSAYDIKSWLMPHHVTNLKEKPELYVVGSQESNTPGFPQLLQTTLGNDYIQIASAALSLIPSSIINVIAFVRKDVARFVANIETCNVATGIGGVGGNKGGTIITLTYKHTSIALVNCHLAAGVSHVKNRNKDAMDILSRAPVGRRGVSLEMGCDYCFFFGDLNYRVDTLFEIAAAAVSSESWDLLWDFDQLPPEQRNGRVLHAFTESSLNFCPSYRWKIGMHELSNKNGQAASWCDRILLHQRQNFSSRCLCYSSIPTITTSDHRPVYALFRIDCPVYDHTKLSSPFRIEISNVFMQLFHETSASLSKTPDAESNAASVGETEASRDSVATPDSQRDSLSQRDQQRDSQSAASVCTLGIRGACIEGGLLAVAFEIDGLVSCSLFFYDGLVSCSLFSFFRCTAFDSCSHAVTSGFASCSSFFARIICNVTPEYYWPPESIPALLPFVCASICAHSCRCTCCCSFHTAFPT
jgi:hypothetical protein